MDIPRNSAISQFPNGGQDIVCGAWCRCRNRGYCQNTVASTKQNCQPTLVEAGCAFHFGAVRNSARGSPGFAPAWGSTDATCFATSSICETNEPHQDGCRMPGMLKQQHSAEKTTCVEAPSSQLCRSRCCGFFKSSRGDGRKESNLSQAVMYWNLPCSAIQIIEDGCSPPLL